jgi:hypothetical protein
VALTESIAVTYNDFRWVLFVAFAAKLAFPDREVGGELRVEVGTHTHATASALSFPRALP